MKHHQRWKAELALLGVTLIWGATFVAVKDALAYCSPILFLLLRFSVAAIALGLGFRRRAARIDFWNGKGLVAASVTGLALFLAYVFQTVGLRWTTATKSAFLTSLCVVLVPLLGIVVLAKTPTWRELLGAGAALCGAGIMSWDGSGIWGGKGELLTLACAVSFAVHILLVGKFSRQVAYEVMAVGQIAAAAVLAGLTFWWLEEARIRWVAEIGVAVVLTGLLATALAFTVQVWAQQYTSANRTVLIFALEPVFAAVVAHWLTSEQLTWRIATGGALIFGGVMVAETNPDRRKVHLTY